MDAPTTSFCEEGGRATSADDGGGGLGLGADGDGLGLGAMTTSFCEEGGGANSADGGSRGFGLAAGGDGLGFGALTTSFCGEGGSAVVMSGPPDPPPPQAPRNALDTSDPTSAVPRIGQMIWDIRAKIDNPLEVSGRLGVA